MKAVLLTVAFGAAVILSALLIAYFGIKYAPADEPPFCECGGVKYRSYECRPPEGLPARCYEHHYDPHADRVW